MYILQNKVQTPRIWLFSTFQTSSPNTSPLPREYWIPNCSTCSSRWVLVFYPRKREHSLYLEGSTYWPGKIPIPHPTYSSNIGKYSILLYTISCSVYNNVQVHLFCSFILTTCLSRLSSNRNSSREPFWLPKSQSSMNSHKKRCDLFYHTVSPLQSKPFEFRDCAIFPDLTRDVHWPIYLSFEPSFLVSHNEKQEARSWRPMVKKQYSIWELLRMADSKSFHH